jgi:hypothetical protein
MKLCAIFNVWHDWEWLKIATDNLEGLVDGIIIVASEKSNYGEHSPIPEEWRDKVLIREPMFHVAHHSETDKRNYGLSLARKSGYTHFISMDADELYIPLEFNAGKQYLNDHPELSGLVCRVRTYFKSPELTIGLDTTLVPFIHKVTPDIKHEFNREYPFSWEGKSIRIDPTRSLNINSGVEMFEIEMHHYSWVREDYEIKIRNSSARSNLERSSIRQDLGLAKVGFYCKFYGRELIRASNHFKIPEMNVSSI